MENAATLLCMETLTLHQELDKRYNRYRKFIHESNMGEGPDPYEMLGDLAWISRWSRFTLRAYMQACIEDGATYQDVADAVGITRQTAWEALNGRNGKPATDLNQLKLF